MINKIIVSIAFLTVTTFCFGQTKTDGYFLFPAENKDLKKGWVVLLPGSSGLKIFKDKSFYHRRADSLSKENYDVILIDYKAYFKASANPNKPTTTAGDKIAWAVEEVLKELKNQSWIDEVFNGYIIGWSLAGEGVFNLVKDNNFVSENKIKKAVLFYPSNRDTVEIRSSIPLLILVGDSDNVIDIKDLKERAEQCKMTNLILFNECYHGFDIESLTKKKTMRFPPLFGKKYIFFYNKTEAIIANNEMMEFLEK